MKSYWGYRRVEKKKKKSLVVRGSYKIEIGVTEALLRALRCYRDDERAPEPPPSPSPPPHFSLCNGFANN